MRASIKWIIGLVVMIVSAVCLEGCSNDKDVEIAKIKAQAEVDKARYEAESAKAKASQFQDAQSSPATIAQFKDAYSRRQIEGLWEFDTSYRSGRFGIITLDGIGFLPRTRSEMDARYYFYTKIDNEFKLIGSGRVDIDLDHGTMVFHDNFRTPYDQKAEVISFDGVNLKLNIIESDSGEKSTRSLSKKQ